MKIRYTWENIDQPPDERPLGDLLYSVTTYQEFQNGLCAALKELEEYSPMIDELELVSSPYENERQRLKRMIEFGKKELDKDNAERFFPDSIELKGVSYGSLRYLKAGILLRAHQLDNKRHDALLSHRFIPRSILQSFDERIEQLLNLAEQGGLCGLRPADIFFEVIPLGDQDVERDEPTLRSATTGAGYVASEIPIVDPELRDRCLKILRAVTEGGSDVQLDTVIREMSIVLETRVRQVSGCDEKVSGAALFSNVMSGEKPVVKFSDQKDIQESAHLLFRGYAGVVRNEVMHKMVPTYTRERVLQLLGTVDYLLFLLSRAELPHVPQQGD